MSKAKRLLVVAGAVIIGVILLISGFGDYRTSKKLQAQGKSTTGDVTEGEERRGRKGRRSYYLTVNFTTEAGQNLEERQRVSSSVYREAAEARKVPVTYLPSDPHVCSFGPKVETKTGGLIGGVIAIGVGLFLGFKKSDDDGSDASPADPEQELLAENSRYDDQQKAA